MTDVAEAGARGGIGTVMIIATATTTVTAMVTAMGMTTAMAAAAGETALEVEALEAEAAGMTTDGSSCTTYYHPDHLGSTSYVTDEGGRKSEYIGYFPFGETWVQQGGSAAGREVAYQYTAKELDQETGLYYYGARYYDPRTSVWQSPDPILDEYLPTGNKEKDKNLAGMGGVFNVPNLNLYAYVHQNLIKYNDPDGRETNPVSGKAYIFDNQILNNSSNPNKGHYGFVRDGGAKFHSGNDLAGAKGSSLVAPISGRVVQAGFDGKNGGGYVLRIERNEKTDDGKSVFIHMSHLNSLPSVKVGEKVIKGKTTIGEIGNSGNAERESPHVHLSVMVGGQKRDNLVNPQTWFKENPPKKED